MKQGNLFGGPIDFNQPQPAADITAGRHGGNQQSEAAHAKVLPTAAAERARVLEWLKHRGRGGGTSKEYSAETGRPLNCISGRWTELKNNGLIVHAGLIRDGAAVYIATEEECL